MPVQRSEYCRRIAKVAETEVNAKTTFSSVTFCCRSNRISRSLTWLKHHRVAVRSSRPSDSDENKVDHVSGRCRDCGDLYRLCASCQWSKLSTSRWLQFPHTSRYRLYCSNLTPFSFRMRLGRFQRRLPTTLAGTICGTTTAHRCGRSTKTQDYSMISLQSECFVAKLSATCSRSP